MRTFLEKSPVSAATIGAMGLGMLLGPVGVLGGVLLGGALDTVVGARSKAKIRKKIKRQFIAALLARYRTQIFISSLEKMASAISYLQSLGLKPGTPQFDDYLKRLLFVEIGYKGNCELDLYGPEEDGKRPLLAEIDRNGKMLIHAAGVDPSFGEKWNQACKELHKAALQEWAEEQKDNILIERELQAEKKQSHQVMSTKALVNGGVILLMLGYTIRTKRKLKKMRSARETS